MLLLQPLSGEVFHRKTTSMNQYARLDIKSGGFGGQGSKEAFFFTSGVKPFLFLVLLSAHSIHVPSTREREPRPI